MNTYQLWILNPSNQFQPIGKPAPAVDANLWYQLLLAHFGSDEIQMRPVTHTSIVSAVSSSLAARALEKAIEQGKAIDIPSLGITITGTTRWPGEG